MTDKPNDPKYDAWAAHVAQDPMQLRAFLVYRRNWLEGSLLGMQTAFAKVVALGFADEVDVAAYKAEVDAINRRLTEVREMLAQID